MINHKTIYYFALIFVFTSCEKVINVDLKNAEPKIVIEGLVDNSGNAGKVIISKSVAFITTNTFPAVTGATVKVTDNVGNAYILSESSAGTYSNASLIGVSGRTYTLNVTAEGRNYTATSTMPQQVNFDTVFQDRITLSKTIFIANATFDDPTGFGNNYQFIETVNGKRNKTIFILDDQYQDGGTITNQLIDEDVDLKIGDHVEIDMQCLDKSIYRYLRGMADLQGGNTVPANPDSNISNGALGYFSANTSQKRTLIIQ